MIHRSGTSSHAGLRSLRARVVAAVAVLAGLGALTTGCGSSSGAATTASGQTVIRYQSYPGQVDLSELADALGYIPDIKLKRLGDVQGGPQSLQALATGQVDYGGAFNGAIANVIASGAPIKAVISYYGSNDKTYGGLLVKNGSPITKPQDLIGKKVALNTLGANFEAVLDAWFQKGGLTDAQIKQITLVPLPLVNAEAALRHGQVDAAYISGALLQKAIGNGGLKVLFKDTDIVGDYNGGSYCMTDKFLKSNPTAAKEFIGGMAKAAEYTRSHSADQVKAVMTKYLTSHGRADAVAGLSAWTSSGIASTGGAISDNDFSPWTKWLQWKGLLKGSADISSLYTNEFNPYASAGSASGAASPTGTESQ